MAIWSRLRARACGIFLHISSLPSEQGIGNFGYAAYEFVDFLRASGMCYWQLCPLNPTSFGDSPYQSPSAMAGNPYFIDFNALVEVGLLSRNDLTGLSSLPHHSVEFGKLYETFWPVARMAYDNFLRAGRKRKGFDNYCRQADWWLSDYANFMALKERFRGAVWTEWPKEFANYSTAQHAITEDETLLRSVQFYKFIQWIFDCQWKKLKTYAKQNKISIIGDLPIFVGFDSSDVWSNRQFFQLRSDGNPAVVSGVPPDAFSSTGQLWGNPLYDWHAIVNDNFSWWDKRIRRSLELYDVIRLDHFRGFCDYWEIPADETTAINGEWKKSVGVEFFKHIKKVFPGCQFIAEDLGYLSSDVAKLLQMTGLPGMNILHFAFDGHANNKYLPHEHEKNSVFYLGTHDNDTTIGWFNCLSDVQREQIRKYFQMSCCDVPWDLIRKSYMSPARLLILNMQDVLNLGTEARFNTPSTKHGNWTWRMQKFHMENLNRLQVPEYLTSLGKTYDRC